MRGLYWKLGGTALAGAAIGLIGGQATTAGIVSVAPHASVGRALDGVAGDEAAFAPAKIQPVDMRIVSACDDCSDYELGFRFAAARKVRDSAECGEFSWSYQRGCLAWLRQDTGG